MANLVVPQNSQVNLSVLFPSSLSKCISLTFAELHLHLSQGHSLRASPGVHIASSVLERRVQRTGLLAASCLVAGASRVWPRGVMYLVPDLQTQPAGRGEAQQEPKGRTEENIELQSMGLQRVGHD